MAGKTELEILQEVELELERFSAKLKQAKIEQSTPNNWSSQKFASCKRAAMDLKNELTKLTQSSKYKYS